MPFGIMSRTMKCPHKECGLHGVHTFSGNLLLSGSNLVTFKCPACGGPSLFLDEELIYPKSFADFVPNPDLPKDIQADCLEAAAIFNDSPRGAAALLRLAVQKLCNHLEPNGKNLNESIRLLVQDGLPQKVQKALDVVRVVGNNAVHPGQIDVADNPRVALELFQLVNIIADVMLTQPKKIDKLFDALPQKDKAQIHRRDH